MITVKQSLSNDPHSFNQIHLIEVGHRTLLKKNADDWWETYNPPAMTRGEFFDELAKIGKTVRTEQYFCPITGLNVLRGWITKPDGKDYFWYLHYGEEIYEQVAQGVLRALEYSGRTSEGGAED